MIGHKANPLEIIYSHSGENTYIPDHLKSVNVYSLFYLVADWFSSQNIHYLSSGQIHIKSMIMTSCIGSDNKGTNHWGRLPWKRVESIRINGPMFHHRSSFLQIKIQKPTANCKRNQEKLNNRLRLRQNPIQMTFYRRNPISIDNFTHKLNINFSFYNSSICTITKSMCNLSR